MNAKNLYKKKKKKTKKKEKGKSQKGSWHQWLIGSL
jgi:hypothetical protein